MNKDQGISNFGFLSQFDAPYSLFDIQIGLRFAVSNKGFKPSTLIIFDVKKIFLYLLSLGITISCFSQVDSTVLPPYKRSRLVPAFDLLMTDSVSHYTRNDLPSSKPVLIILFDPNCDHCQHETEEILKNIDSLRNIEIVMATNAD